MIKAAVVCSNPWNLDTSNICLQSTYLGREVYSKAMGTNMKALAERHYDMISTVPGVSFERMRNVTYLYEFDREIQAPSFGYPSEGAYYRDASSVDMLLNVRVPLLAINALDDPVRVTIFARCTLLNCSQIAPMAVLPFIEVLQTPYVILCTTSLGGHLSWFERGGQRWHSKPVGYSTSLSSLLC